MKYCACFFYLLLLLSTVAPTQGDSRDRRECEPGHFSCSAASTILLQRASQLQTAIDAVDAPKAFKRLDHDGLEWPGGPASQLSSKTTNITRFDGGKSVQNGAGAQDPAIRNITFITVKDPFFETNLGRSTLWQNRGTLPHQWLLIDNWENAGISSLYAETQKKASNDLMVFLHSDVLLPEAWYAGFMQKLAQIEALDPDWAVLGTAGVALDWNPSAGPGPRIASSITDFAQTFSSGTDSLKMQSFDESLLILRRNISPSFDAQLPGFDLYGTDIVLAARQAGKNAYLLNIPVLHKTVDVDGQTYDAAVWKVKLASIQGRAAATQDFLSKKWTASGLLPAFGTAFDVWPR